MTTHLTEPTTDRIADRPVVTTRGGAIPYLAVRGAREAISWYEEVFGAELDAEPIVMPDGRIGHAELSFPSGAIYLADEFPDIGVAAPQPDAVPVSLVLAVADTDAATRQARAAGAIVAREPADAHGHRGATVVDPFGHRWLLQSPLPMSSPAVAWSHGDAPYHSLWVPDVPRATDFYSSVLQWRYLPDHGEHDRQVIGATPAQGIFASGEPSTLFSAYLVDDVAESIRRVRAAGGTAQEPTTEPYGLASQCVDDQGRAFTIYQPPDDGFDAAEPAPANGLRAGDLAYVTLLVPDASRARAFYSAVLGWEFTPGHVDDGWQVTNTHPMTGLAGGHERVTGVPMWRVDDIAAAVARVRAAGGEATDPERQPYGLSSECRDDQGVAFYLGQL